MFYFIKPGIDLILCYLVVVSFGLIDQGSVMGQSIGKLREPIPLKPTSFDRAIEKNIQLYSFSPDGNWLAYSVDTGEGSPAGGTISNIYLDSGMRSETPHFRVEVLSLITGETLISGDPQCHCLSMTPSWSPDSKRLAYYSDEGGQAGLWVWDLKTRKANRFSGVIVRPPSTIDSPHWFTDSERLVCRILPDGITIAEANAGDGNALVQNFPRVGVGEASVIVRRFDPSESKELRNIESRLDSKRMLGDLAVLDLRTKAVTRVVRNTPVRWYELSPKDNAIAFLVPEVEINTRQNKFELRIAEVQGGQAKTLARNVLTTWSDEWNWSPDGRRIAYTTTGEIGEGEIVLVSTIDGSTRKLKGDGLPSFKRKSSSLQQMPLWDRSAKNLYSIANGQLWQMNAHSGLGKVVGVIPGAEIETIIAPYSNRATIWSSNGGRKVWVSARRLSDQRRMIFSIELSTGKVGPGLAYSDYPLVVRYATSDAKDAIAFCFSDESHSEDIWMLDVRSGSIRQVTHVGESNESNHYELGTAKDIEWRNDDGETLYGSLLLPPGYVAGRRLPLVVIAYPTNRPKGFRWPDDLKGGITFLNMQMLATRGYAVFTPSAPFRQGHRMADEFKAIMGGVNAAIDQGYADPDRLAVMGHSHGSLSALMLIAQTTRFRAAVITGNTSHPDLVVDYLRSPTRYQGKGGQIGGTLWENRGAYLENSPIFQFDKIQTPVLIGDGEKDNKGDAFEPNAIYDALRFLKKPVEYRLYQWDGHVPTMLPNVIDFWQRRLEFLAENLNLGTDEKGTIVFEGDRAKPRSLMPNESTKGKQ